MGTSRAVGKGTDRRGFLKKEKEEMERELRTEQTVREKQRPVCGAGSTDGQRFTSLPSKP